MHHGRFHQDEGTVISPSTPFDTMDTTEAELLLQKEPQITAYWLTHIQTNQSDVGCMVYVLILGSIILKTETMW